MRPGATILLWTLALVVPVAVSFAGDPPKPRPAEWAQPVTNSTIGNFFRVSPDLFRSEQVEAKDIPQLKALGIRTILNLRNYNQDSKKFAEAGFNLIHFKLKAGSVSAADLREILRQLREAPKPVLVHCWHGSDRTGFVVAGYRILMQNWSTEKAIEELQHGGFGYHARTYPNVIRTLREAKLQPLTPPPPGTPPAH